MFLDAGHLHRGQEYAIGNLRKPLGAAADAHERLYVVVPGGEVGVADRPVHAVSVPGVGLEVEIAHPVALPAPHDRPSAHLAAPDPAERLVRVGRVGVLDVVDEELARDLVAGVALALDGLRGCEGPAVIPAAVRHLVGREMLGVVLLGDDHRAGLEDEDAGAQFGEFLGGPAARHAGADDDGVVFLAARTDVHGPNLHRGKGHASLEGPEGCTVAECFQSHLRGEVGSQGEPFHVVEEVSGCVRIGILAQAGQFRVEIADVLRLLLRGAVREVGAEAFPGRGVHRVEPGQEPVPVVVVKPSVHERGHELGHARFRGARRVRRGDDDLGQRGHDAGAGRGEEGGGCGLRAGPADALTPIQQFRKGGRGHDQRAGRDSPQDADGLPSLHALPYPMEWTSPPGGSTAVACLHRQEWVSECRTLHVVRPSRQPEPPRWG